MQKEKFISGMNGHIVLSPRERERMEMEWADIVDLLTAKIPDQKGETKRDD